MHFFKKNSLPLILVKSKSKIYVSLILNSKEITHQSKD